MARGGADFLDGQDAENPSEEEGMSSVPKLLQVMPAEGWAAVYAYRDEDGQVVPYEVPLVS